MITTDEEYTITCEDATHFAERLATLEAHTGSATRDRARKAAIRAQLDELQRDLALWKADIREPVPGIAAPIDPPQVADGVGVLSDEELQQAGRLVATAQKRGEIANIDRQIGTLLDRIADWRRHRAWLEREIAELDARASSPEPAQTGR